MLGYINGYSGGGRWSALLPMQLASTWRIVFTQGPRVVIEMWTNKRPNMACEEQPKEECSTWEEKHGSMWGMMGERAWCYLEISSEPS